MKSPLTYIPERHRRWVPVLAFLVGVAFDVLTLGRIDSLRNLAKLGACLAASAFLVLLELSEAAGGALPTQGIAARIRPYRETAAHFLLGVLLSAYTVFYFKSASFLSSFGFLLAMAGLLVANEWHGFRRHGIAVRTSLFALCLASYAICVVPMAIGFVGAAPFLLALALSLAANWALLLGARARARKLRNGAQKGPKAAAAAAAKATATSAATAIGSRAVWLRGALPVFAVHVAFGLAYFAKILPPVPLSASYFGVFHKVERVGDHYVLTTERPFWRFWENGDQSFEAHPGDAIYAYVRVFSPSGFRDRVQMRWLLDEGRHGWQTQDVIPLEVQGGRAEGYRGYTIKSHFQPGHWRIQVETSDEREIARLYVTVTAAEAGAGAPPVLLWQD